MKQLNNYIIEKLRINNDTKLGNRLLDDCEEWCKYLKRNGCEVLESKKWMYVIYLKKGTSIVDNRDKHINFDEKEFTYPFIQILNEKSYWNPWRWTEKCITIYNDKSSKEKLPIDDFDIVWDEMEPDHIRGLAFSTKNADIIIDELNKYYEKSK